MENPYPRLAKGKPPLHKRALALIFGRTKYFVDTEHFDRPRTIYLCYCRHHKVFFEDYPHEPLNYVTCPVCWDDEHWMDDDVDEDLMRDILWDDYWTDDDEWEELEEDEEF